MSEKFANEQGSIDKVNVARTESSDVAPVNRFNLSKVSVDQGVSALPSGWGNEVRLTKKPVVGGQLFWQSEKGNNGNSSVIEEIRSVGHNRWVIKTQTSTYQLDHLSENDNTGESQEKVLDTIEISDKENNFSLRKVALQDGQSSSLQEGWASKIILAKDPAVGEPLQWMDHSGSRGNSSYVQEITEIGEGKWRIKTQTSEYELTHAPSEAVEETFESSRLDVEALLANPLTPEDVRSALNIEEFRPIKSVEVEGMTFNVSKVFPGSRDTCLVYTADKQGGVQLSVYYKSNSDGGWRLNAPTPYSHNNQELSKGLISDDGTYRHYTKETKPHESIAALLDSMPVDNSGGSAAYDKHRNIRDKNKNEHNFSEYKKSILAFGDRPRHIKSVTDSGVNIPIEGEPRSARVYRGIIYGKEPLNVESLEGIEYPDGFVPDFSAEPKKVYYQTHTILSERDQKGRAKNDIRVEVFQGQVTTGEKQMAVDWHMATSPSGDVWVEKIIPEDCYVNKFGTYDKLYDFGIFDLKPVDYESQVNQIPAQYKKQINYEYYKITDLFSALKPIKEYKRSRLVSPEQRKAV